MSVNELHERAEATAPVMPEADRTAGITLKPALLELLHLRQSWNAVTQRSSEPGPAAPGGPAGEPSQRDIIAVMAHELRNPLAVMSATLQACRLAGGSLSSMRVQEILTRQLRNAVQLVEDLAHLSEADGPLPALRVAPFDLARLVRDGVQDVQGQLMVRRQTLSVDLPEEPVVLTGDALRLGQVLANLLDNASKYTPVGGRIAVRLTSDRTEAVLRVRDDGCGIRSGDLPRVFDLHFRAPYPRGARPSGKGIGLALARYLVERHGGSIQAHSAGHHRGSEFVVHLPLPGDPPAGTGARL